MEARSPSLAPRRRLGTALAELCLVLPIMLVLLSAVIDVGYYLWVVANVHQAVREGGRFAMTDRGWSATQIKNQIIESGGIAGLTSSEVTVLTTGALILGSVNYRKITINVSHTHTFLVPLFWTSSGSIQLKSQVVTPIVTGLVNPG
jgi:Flp pilus assembly protein TadG